MKLIWTKEVIENQYKCNKCGANLIDQAGEPRGVIVLRNMKGYCKKCGVYLCDVSVEKEK